MKKQEFIKMTGGLGTPRTTLNVPTSEFIGVPEEEEEQEIETYLKK